MVLPHGENGEQEQLSSGSGSSAQWGVSASSPPFNFQTSLTMEPPSSDYNRSSSHIIISGHGALGGKFFCNWIGIFSLGARDTLAFMVEVHEVLIYKQ